MPRPGRPLHYDSHLLDGSNAENVKARCHRVRGHFTQHETMEMNRRRACNIRQIIRNQVRRFPTVSIRLHDVALIVEVVEGGGQFVDIIAQLQSDAIAGLGLGEYGT